MKLTISHNRSTDEPLTFALPCDTGDEPINFEEVLDYNIQLDCTSNTLLAVFLGDVQLDFETIGSQENTILLKFETEDLISTQTTKYFSFFRNNAGASELRFIFKELKSAVIVPIYINPKVSADLIDFWLERMFTTFPVVAIPPQIALMTLGEAKRSKNVRHLSLAYLLKLIAKLNVRIRRGVLSERLLAFNKRPSTRHSNFVRSSSLMKKGAGKTTNHWRLTNFDSQSIVRKGLNTFELKKFEKTRLVNDYDIGINKALTVLLTQTSRLLKKHADKDDKNPLFKIAPKSVIINRKNYYKIVNDFSLELSLQAKSLSKIKRSVESKFLDIDSIKLAGSDSRFPELTRTVMLLKNINHCLTGLLNGENKTFPLPTVDFIFEMFCFAILHDGIQRNGFDLQQSELDSGIPFYSVFHKGVTNTTIRLFYDTSLSGYRDSNSTMPLYDSRKHLQKDNLHRPDFIIEIEQNNKSFIAVLDAKYMNKSKANETLSMKSKSIVTKYFCYKVNNSEIAMPPCFIGAMYFNEKQASSNDVMDSKLSKEFQTGGQKPSYLQIYGVGITQNPDEEIDFLLTKILDHTTTLSEANGIFDIAPSKHEVPSPFQTLAPKVS
ncbi:nuclease domain-containing protein [Alphaproteobacteria bacterium]|nr:nuclease domain-containing protein [Alphaproteobacteria bacterium]